MRKIVCTAIHTISKFTQGNLHDIPVQKALYHLSGPGIYACAKFSATT